MVKGSGLYREKATIWTVVNSSELENRVPFGTHLIEVCNDLVEKPETLHSHVVAVQLNVEVIEISDGGKQHSYLTIRLVVQVLTQIRQGT